MTSLFPPRESLTSGILAGDGNIKKLFLRCTYINLAEPQNNSRCAAKAFFYCPTMNSHRPRSQNTAKEQALIPEKRFKKNMTQMSCKFGEIIKKL